MLFSCQHGESATRHPQKSPIHSLENKLIGSEDAVVEEHFLLDLNTRCRVSDCIYFMAAGRKSRGWTSLYSMIIFFKWGWVWDNM